MKMLYKYPQSEFSYARLVEENRQRGKENREFELTDTGIFDANRYFDVLVGYAKASPEDLLIRITAYNRGQESATLNILPHVWFRNTWSWGCDRNNPAVAPRGKPNMFTPRGGVIEMKQAEVGTRWLYCDSDPGLLFCNNETNVQQLHGVHNTQSYFKDGINDYVVHNVDDAVNPDQTGTKTAANYQVATPAGECQ